MARGRRSFLQSPVVRWGAPMVLFTVVGYLGMSKVRSRRSGVGLCTTVKLTARFTSPQFVTGKIEALDRNVSKRSERSVQLELAHKVRGRIAVERPCSANSVASCCPGRRGAAKPRVRPEAHSAPRIRGRRARPAGPREAHRCGLTSRANGGARVLRRLRAEGCGRASAGGHT